MEKVMLIAGCSNAAGYEIDGSEDSAYNRQNSFGNQLAHKMGYRAINTGTGGSTNASIARGVIEWVTNNYNPDTMELFVLVAWTESARLEVPFHRPTWYNDSNPGADWVSESSFDYLRVNQSWPGGNEDDQKVIPYYQEFIVNNLTYMEILSANAVLQIEYFLKMQKIDYVMCNTMHMFTHNDYLDFYLDRIDKKNYLDMDNNENSFYWKYRNSGYTNPKARYWHHDIVPHTMYADELHKFIMERQC